MVGVRKPSNRPLAVFLSLSLALHLVAIWYAQFPDRSPGPPSRFQTLRVVIDRPSTPDAPEQGPGKVVVTSDLRQRAPLEPGSPPIRQVTGPPESEDGADNALPDVDAHELLQDMAPRDETSGTGFGARPETHGIFKPLRLVRAPMPAAPWSRGIWRPSKVTGESRFDSVEGHRMWIRRYDNGDIRVCERARDDLMDPWDDDLPFVCEW